MTEQSSDEIERGDGFVLCGICGEMSATGEEHEQHKREEHDE